MVRRRVNNEAANDQGFVLQWLDNADIKAAAIDLDGMRDMLSDFILWNGKTAGRRPPLQRTMSQAMRLAMRWMRAVDALGVGDRGDRRDAYEIVLDMGAN